MPRLSSVEYLKPFRSSSIEWAGYDAEHRLLSVGFVGNDEKYEYLNVPVKKWEELKEAESKGQYINFNIKPFYKYRRL